MNHLAIYALYPNVVCIDDDAGAFDKNGNKVTIDEFLVQKESDRLLELSTINACKEKAKQLLAKSDWSVLPDVGLANQDAFVFYRLNLRNLVKNPVANPVWEAEPTPIWL